MDFSNRSKDELDELLKTIDHDKFILEGIFTHYATADGEIEAFKQQQEMFYDLIDPTEFKYIHFFVFYAYLIFPRILVQIWKIAKLNQKTATNSNKITPTVCRCY